MENNKNLMIVGIVALIAIIGGVIFFTSQSSDEETEPVASNTSQQAQVDEVNEQEAQSSQTIVVLAQATPDLSTLVDAVVAADLVETLNGDGPFTVFAPTNDAFGALPEGTLEDLLKPENKDQLASILTYHVVPAKAMSSDLKDGQKIKTVQGEELTVSIDSNGVKINDAMVVTADVEASNGVVHVIDSVLLPQN